MHCLVLCFLQMKQSELQILREILSSSFQKFKKILGKKSLILPSLQLAQKNLLKVTDLETNLSNLIAPLLKGLLSKSSKLIEASTQTFIRLVSNGFIKQKTSIKLVDSKQLPQALRQEKALHKILLYLSINIQQKEESCLVSVSRLIMSLLIFIHQNQSDYSKCIDWILTAISFSRSSDTDKQLRYIFFQLVRNAIQLSKDSQIQLTQFASRSPLKNTIPAKILNHVVNQAVLNSAVENREPLDVLSQGERAALNCGRFGWCAMCNQKGQFLLIQEKIAICSVKCRNEFRGLQQLSLQRQEGLRTNQIQLEVCRGLLQKIAKNLSEHQEHMFSIQKMPRLKCIMIQALSYVTSVPNKLTLTLGLNQLLNCFQTLLVSLHPQQQNFPSGLLVMRKCIKMLNVDYRLMIKLGGVVDLLVVKMVPFWLKIQTQNYSKTKRQVLRIVSSVLEHGLSYFSFLDIRHRRVVKQCYRSLQFLSNDRELLGQCLKLVESQLQMLKKTKVRDQARINADIQNIICKFNSKPEKAILTGIQESFIENSAEAINDFLWQHISRLDKKALGELLGSNKPIFQATLKLFIKKINFQGQSIQNALRLMLDHFRLPGQSQQIQRILDSFSHIFIEQNEAGKVKDFDSCYLLSYLLMMLQTNLHNPSVQQSDRLKLQYMVDVLSKKNGGEDFQLQFLQYLYNSIGKTPLAFQPKQIELDMNAHIEANNYRKLHQLFNRQNFILVNRVFNELSLLTPIKRGVAEESCVKEMLSSCGQHMISIYQKQLQLTQDKEGLKQLMNMFQNMLILSKYELQGLCFNAFEVLFKAVKLQLLRSQSPKLKQILIIKQMLDASCRFGNKIGRSWYWIINLSIKFQEYKLIEKNHQISAHQNQVLGVANKKFWISDAFIDGIYFRTNSISDEAFLSFLKALFQFVKKESSVQTGEPASLIALQKLNQIFDNNIERLCRCWENVWKIIGQNLSDLVLGPKLKVSQFSVDCLKQITTTVLKKQHDQTYFKSTILKPFEEVSMRSQLRLELREFILNCLIHIINYFGNQLQQAWKNILNIINHSLMKSVSAGTELLNDDIMKILKSISDNYLQQIYQYRLLYIQALQKLAQKTQEFLLTVAVQLAVNYLRQSYLIHNPQKREEACLPLLVLQTEWIPLITVLSLICGNQRQNIQKTALQSLFTVLKQYGNHFNSQFWQTVLKGVIVPLFDQLQYTWHLRLFKEQQHKNAKMWFQNICSDIFGSMQQIIDIFFPIFSEMLGQILKIYRSCISNSSQELAQISIKAAQQLSIAIGSKLQSSHWDTVIEFWSQVVTYLTPNQILSQENWQKFKQKQNSKSYNLKCKIMHLVVLSIQKLLTFHISSISEAQLLILEELLSKVYDSSIKFDKDRQLRSFLKEEGALQEGEAGRILLQQERRAMQSLLTLKALRVRQFSKQNHLIDYLSFVQYFLKLYVEKHQNVQNSSIKSVQDTRLICKQVLLPQLMSLDDCQLKEKGPSIFSGVIQLTRFFKGKGKKQSSQNEFQQDIRKLLMRLYELK